jgi:hypothetical protein
VFARRPPVCTRQVCEQERHLPHFLLEHAVYLSAACLTIDVRVGIDMGFFLFFVLEENVLVRGILSGPF